MSRFYSFFSWIIFYQAYILHFLYPDSNWWISKLISYLHYSELGRHLSQILVLFPLDIYSQNGNGQVTWDISFLVFWRISLPSSIMALLFCSLTNILLEFPFLHNLVSILISYYFYFWIIGILLGESSDLIVNFVCISLMTHDTGHFFFLLLIFCSFLS